ncbi:hypothetical protein [Lentzea sp. NPDC059081]|uniref:hypothetical protein n=1 Tax=Lentzea sp. NPDC059081 TaxID=3346719 RepID=UPI0036823BA4
MTPPSPREPAADLGEVLDDVELIAPWALLLFAALAGIAGTGGLQLVIFPSTQIDLVLFLSQFWKW